MEELQKRGKTLMVCASFGLRFVPSSGRWFAEFALSRMQDVPLCSSFTPRRFPSYLLLAVLLCFLFIFYLPRCTPIFLVIFILLYSNNNLLCHKCKMFLFVVCVAKIFIFRSICMYKHSAFLFPETV